MEAADCGAMPVSRTEGFQMPAQRRRGSRRGGQRQGRGRTQRDESGRFRRGSHATSRRSSGPSRGRGNGRGRQAQSPRRDDTGRFASRGEPGGQLSAGYGERGRELRERYGYGRLGRDYDPLGYGEGRGYAEGGYDEERYAGGGRYGERRYGDQGRYSESERRYGYGREGYPYREYESRPYRGYQDEDELRYRGRDYDEGRPPRRESEYWDRYDR
jgi:hypothetical protein